MHSVDSKKATKRQSADEWNSEFWLIERNLRGQHCGRAGIPYGCWFVSGRSVSLGSPPLFRRPPLLLCPLFTAFTTWNQYVCLLCLSWLCEIPRGLGPACFCPYLPAHSGSKNVHHIGISKSTCVNEWNSEWSIISSIGYEQDNRLERNIISPRKKKRLLEHGWGMEELGSITKPLQC